MKITMAQCRQSAHEFIQNAFSPMVAVLCSHDAEQLCQKNNLSFVEMIQPFCRMSQETTFRDPGNNTHTLKNLHIIVKDMNSSIPQPALARKMMSEAVSNSQAPADPTHGSNVMSYGNYNLQVNSACPWYEAYREMFLQVAYPSEHEFLKHFLACIYVVSSIHADPMDQFLRLAQQQHQQQHQSPSKLPKWFSPNVLKYYVLLHDVADGDEAKAESVYQAMKTTYGPAMCHLLQINSRTSVSNDSTAIPDPWSQFINKSEYRVLTKNPAERKNISILVTESAQNFSLRAGAGTRDQPTVSFWGANESLVGQINVKPHRRVLLGYLKVTSACAHGLEGAPMIVELVKLSHKSQATRFSLVQVEKVKPKTGSDRERFHYVYFV